MTEIERLKEKFRIRLPNVKISLEKSSNPEVDSWDLCLVFKSREIAIEWQPKENIFSVLGLGVQYWRRKIYKDSVKLFDDVVIALDD
ncbi:MAG: hypothetical protein G01um101413_779 [Parcubacteria group bacterium Gr01-1014_13]|nr:MAG: hypothetical protein G01um101413_779 [Parcubacteria group bacterium Gr01-1014_13]